MKTKMSALLAVSILLLSGCSNKTTTESMSINTTDNIIVESTEVLSSDDLFGNVVEEDTGLYKPTESGEAAITTVIETTTKESTEYYTTAPKRDRWAALGTKPDPIDSLEDQTYEETTVAWDYGSLETTAATTTQAPVETTTVPQTTIANTQPAQKVENWGSGDLNRLDSAELPSFYKTRGSVAYVDKTDVPDSNIFEKDAYGNYIIPMQFLRNPEQYSKALPYNSYGKIPYCFAYDSNGTVLNPLPKEYEEFKSMFMFGQSQDYNNRSVNYTKPAFE